MSNEEDSAIVQCLETLEDTSLYTKNSHVKCFQLLKFIFDEGGQKVTPEHVQRIFTVFENSMDEYIPCLPHAIATISSLLTNVKIIDSIPTEVLLPSALSLLHKVKTLFLSHGTDKLRELGLELFVSYPGEVLGTIVTCHSSDLIEIFEVYRPKGETEIKISKEVCVFVHKLLTKLPLDQKKQFVNDGIQVWFSDLIPTVMHLIGVAGFEHMLIYLECLETLADVLVLVEYFHCVEWKSGLFPNICDSEKYPHSIKIQLQSGSDIWHRVWIVIVKLLKHQITRFCAPYGTPINLLLPVVELAYKMDAISRCRAFQCWNTLIDTFSTETNENCLPKRIKLLLIPLTVNNAKTEATALTKFQTWWHLITKFQYKFDKYTNEILIAFIHFAFGKDLSGKKPNLIGASQLYDGVKLQCLQAFAQIVGHGECDCCTDLPRLNGKLMNTKLLASNWEDWIFALKQAIMLAYTIGENCENKCPNNTSLSYKLILFIWKAFVFTIADLPPNGVRTDMFHGLIQVLNDFTEYCRDYDNFSGLLFSLSISIFDDEEKTRHVLITGMDDELLPLQKIFSMITCPVMLDVYKRYDTKILMDMLKPLTNLIVESDNTDWLIDNLPSHETSSKLWTALVHSVKSSKLDISPKTLVKLLEWPVHSMHLVNEDKNAAMVWCTMYSLVSSLKRICNMGLDKGIEKCITTPDKNEKIFFRLCLTMCLLKNKLLSKDDVGVLSEVLQNLTSKIDDYKKFEQAVPMLIDTIVVMLNNVTVSENVWLAKISLNCAKHILRVIISEMKSYETGTPIDANIYVILKNMLNAVELLFKIPVYSEINSDFVDELKEKAMSLNKESSLYTFITNYMKSLSVSTSDTVKNKINNSILLLNHNDSDSKNKMVKEFTSPEVKKVKKAKKKEPSILNTVVENGEVYEVVESNWKLNPRKLTENQKEKFQRKREDIPALYQDLSQSQDEFKLSTWKTDSQDTSSNSKSSKSTTKDDASVILKNMPSTDVVPSIMENIMSEKDKNHMTKAKTQNLKSNCSSKIDTPSKVDRSSLSTPKHPKSPRMALKDRIFRNVRNLIEKSSPTKECQTNEFQIENVTKTPVIISDNNAKICNSAPSLLPSDRPHRMKRKPRKFDDVELFGLKKRHYSQNEFQPNSTIETYLNASTNESDSDHSGSADEKKVRRESNSMDRDIVEETLKTAECNVNLKTIQDVPELDAAAVTQDDSIKCVLNEATTENCNILNINDNVLDIQEHDDTLIIQQSHKNQRNGNVQISDKNCTAQDSQTKVEVENIKKVGAAGNVNENNIMVEVNNEIEKNNEPITFIFETPVKKNKEATPNSTKKKSSTRKSRIEKELAIDMVVGHPFLKVQSEKRLTRKQITNLTKSNKRKILNDNPIKKKLVTKIFPKPNQKSKEKVKLTLNNLESTNVTVEETQERSIFPEAAYTTSDEDAPCSEDVIESSQDSSFTNITVNRISKLQPIVAVERINVLPVHSSNTGTQDLLQESDYDMLPSVMNEDVNQENKDDTEFSQNKTAEGEKNQSDLTENMDTEPAPDDNRLVVIVSDDNNKPRVARNTTIVCAETPELAEADTQPNDPKNFAKFDTDNISSPLVIDTLDAPTDTVENVPVKTTFSALESRDDIEIMEPNESLHDCNENDTEVSSPFKNDAQRMKDFLNNTSEISPIKVQSPDRDKTSSTQEISSDYTVVKLTSPVQSNGEPFDKSSSLELLTGEKVSPDKRDMSPPRVDVIVNNGSPSSNLSLKKNRPQALRPSGRAAHMLGLCVPDSLNTIRNLERVEPEEPPKGSTSTPARRNLRILYNADNGDNMSESEVCDNFLKFKKDLPPTDSPSIPILKRKHNDIVDETTASPAGKKKRVSFHDPPVSTTVSVQKYIEPTCIKSPSSASKRLERQITRSYSKPPKRLENTFVKLDTVLSKAVESFTEEQADSLTNDTTVSLDITPVAEVVNTSELNDIDPICPELVECNDPIVNIAVELSSPAMKDLLIKELEGKVCTVGDLAKMTELEVNRLCIKTPKVQMAYKVLKDYINKRMLSAQEVLLETIVLEDDCTSPPVLNEEIIDLQPKTACIETQTNLVTLTDALVQTRTEIVKLASTQTINENLIDVSMQTVESGSKTTSEVIKTCLSERDDFVDILSEELEEASKRKISEKLPTGTIIDILASKCDDVTPKLILRKVFEKLNQNVSNSEGRCKELAFVNDYICTRFDSRELILICSQLIQESLRQTGVDLQGSV